MGQSLRIFVPAAQSWMHFFGAVGSVTSRATMLKVEDELDSVRRSSTHGDD